MDKKFVEGLSFFKKRDNAPSFVLGALSLNKERLMIWLSNQEVDEKGYIRAQILDGKEGKYPYIVVDDYKPNKEERKVIVATDDDVEVPF